VLSMDLSLGREGDAEHHATGALRLSAHHGWWRPAAAYPRTVPPFGMREPQAGVVPTADLLSRFEELRDLCAPRPHRCWLSMIWDPWYPGCLREPLRANES
jgi:hypothetical protein